MTPSTVMVKKAQLPAAFEKKKWMGFSNQLLSPQEVLHDIRWLDSHMLICFNCEQILT